MKYPDKVYEWVVRKDYFKLAEYLSAERSVVKFTNEIRDLTGISLGSVHDLIAWYYYDVKKLD